MSTVLVYTSPARGHLYPIVDVALALRRGGHDVVVQTLADARPEVEAAGLAFRPIDRRIEARPLRDHERGSPPERLREALDCWADRAPYEVDDLRASCDALDPALLLVDANTWGAAAFAEARGTPWAMFLPYCLPVPSRDAPAFGPGFPPPRGPLGRLRDRLVWALLARTGTAPVARLNTLRATLDLPPLAGHAALFGRPDVLLYRTAEPFEYPRRDWPAPVRAIGPGLWAPPADAPDWLATLPRPRVLVSVSTERQDDGAIVEAALTGLADGPGSVIVTTAALDPAAFTPRNDRVVLTRFLPHDAVVPEVDVVVTHGGMGTTQRALAAGVPVCVVPWGRDQAETARRVERCGAGTRLRRGRLTPARLRAAVDEALERRPGAERVARAFREAGGADRAVALLEPLLAGARVPRGARDRGAQPSP